MEEFCKKQHDPNEPASNWNARKQFIVNNWDRYHGNQLVPLAMVWSNIEFYGCTYPPELMKRVQEMARGITIDDTPMDADNKPNINESRSQPFDKPKPTPELTSMTGTSEPVVCGLKEERDRSKLRETDKRPSAVEEIMANTGYFTSLGQAKRKREEKEDENDPVEERDGTKCQKTEKRQRLKEMPCRGWYAALEQGGTTEFEQSECNKRACQPGTTSMYDAVVFALAQNLREQYNMKKIPGSALNRLHAAAMKVPLKRHVEYIKIPPVTMPGTRQSHGKKKAKWLCNMYFDDIFLASVEAESKHASRKGAAKKAVSMLESLNYAVKNENKVSELGRNYSKEIVPLDKSMAAHANVQNGTLDNFTLMAPANQAPAVSNLVNSAFKTKHVPIVFETSDDVRTVDGETGYVCSTIINGISVATGIHMDKRKARNVSINNALALLRDQNSSVKNNPDNTQNVVIEPDIKASDFVIKLENEVYGLSDSVNKPRKAPDSVPVNPPKKVLGENFKQKTSPFNVQNGILDHFTLMEPATPAPAVSILVNSAFKNNVPIDFETSDGIKIANGKSGYVCSTIINGVTVATGTHRFKIQARNMSANNALAFLRDQSSHLKENTDNTQNVVIEPDIKVSDFVIKLENTASDSVLEPEVASDSFSFPVNSPKKTDKQFQLKSPSINVQNSILDNFTLMEPAIPAPAVSILVNSAFKSNVPIEFETTCSNNVRTVDGQTGYVCSTIINGITVGTGIHENKREARNVSANNALASLRDQSFHLKNNSDNTQTVVIERNNKVSDFVIKLENTMSDSVPVTSSQKADKQLKEKISPIKVQNSILDNFTLVEPATPAPAVSILVNSAFKSKVPIEFESSNNVRAVDGETGYVCTTIINGITVGTGIHENKREARNVSANNALASLRDQSSHLKNNPDNTQNVIEPNNKMSDFVIKLENTASGSVFEPDIASDSVPLNSPKKTNEQLKQKISPINVQNQVLANFTLMEPATPAPAVSILVNSAFKSNVPIEFETSNNVRAVDGETGYVCTTIINGITVGTGIHENKREARNVSANNAVAVLRDQSSNRKNNPDNTQNVIEPNSKVSDSDIVPNKATSSVNKLDETSDSVNQFENKVSHPVIEPNKASDFVPLNPPKKAIDENLKPKTSLIIVQNGILDNFTLMEPSDPAPAVSILVNSAFKNHVPIVFEISDNVRTFDGETLYVCKTIINGVTVATGIHTDMKEVKNVSANYALALLRDKSSQLKKSPDNTRNAVTELDNKAPDWVTEPGSRASDSVQVEPPKKVKYAPIGESNIGHKLLRQMGWDGGALQKDGIVDPIEASKKFGRGGLGFVDTSSKISKKKLKKQKEKLKKQKKRQRQTQKRKEKSKDITGGEDGLRQEDRKNLQFDEELCDVKKPQTFELQNLVPVIEAFANQAEKEDLKFSSAFSSRQRREIQYICKGFELDYTSYGKGRQRRLVVRHKLQDTEM